ncbi:hypothetical protein Q7C36_008585 [Tachysurus vachellii]|uniref:Uncharacterized protein n=1 Tax=Tachysurus vachellii TaxID=175792 RepID=A0AA88N724_TACVA|nr:hypothetical protein Q7C36_008585 [Tachysurus vachellii]
MEHLFLHSSVLTLSRPTEEQQPLSSALKRRHISGAFMIESFYKQVVHPSCLPKPGRICGKAYGEPACHPAPAASRAAVIRGRRSSLLIRCWWIPLYPCVWEVCGNRRPRRTQKHLHSVAQALKITCCVDLQISGCAGGDGVLSRLGFSINQVHAVDMLKEQHSTEETPVATFWINHHQWS